MRIFPQNGRDVHRLFHSLWETSLIFCGKVHRQKGSFPQGQFPCKTVFFRAKNGDRKGARTVTFFQKGVAFFLQVCYNDVVKISYLPVAQLDSASDSDSEGRRFESFRVGQKRTKQTLRSFFIQAAGLAYHHRTKCGAYHQRRFAAVVYHHALACISLRLDDIQFLAKLMICKASP